MRQKKISKEREWDGEGEIENKNNNNVRCLHDTQNRTAVNYFFFFFSVNFLVKPSSPSIHSAFRRRSKIKLIILLNQKSCVMYFTRRVSTTKWYIETEPCAACRMKEKKKIYFVFLFAFFFFFGNAFIQS